MGMILTCPIYMPGLKTQQSTQSIISRSRRRTFLSSSRGKALLKEEFKPEPVQVKNGIHIDLFRTFQNRSIQIYAFSHKYSEHTLNAICEALLNDSKYEFEGDISDLSIELLAQYCMKDADLTYRLTSFNDGLLMKLLIVIARIGRLSVEDIARFGVNQWIRGMMFYEHRHLNAIIPRRDELTKERKCLHYSYNKGEEISRRLGCRTHAGYSFQCDRSRFCKSLSKYH